MNILDKYQDMGLTLEAPNTFSYKDQYSHVKYEKLKTCDSNVEIPALSIWTKNTSTEFSKDTAFEFQGIVSMLYNFIGNENANKIIRQSIGELKTPIFREYTSLNVPKYTTMHNDILIMNQNNIPEIGDVYPHINIRNSYDGKSGIEISFGITVLQGTSNLRHSMSFRHIMNSFKQIHSQHAKTQFTSAVGGFVNVVSSNILDFVKQNFETKLSDESLLTTLDMIDKIGERRKKHISDIIIEITKEKKYVTSWDLFMAITRFSTVEKNLNAKLLLEDIVERILTVPVKMMEMMKKINEGAS